MPLNVPIPAANTTVLYNLETPISGYFYELTTALTMQQVKNAFDLVTRESAATEESREVRVSGTTVGTAYWASFLFLRTQDVPTFFPRSNRRENIYGFALFVEVQVSGRWYIGIFKKGTVGINEALGNYLIKPSRRSFSRAFGKGAAYQKLALKRMTASKHELLASSYEADDLKTALPTLGITRSVPRSLRVRHDGHGNISIVPGTFRLQKSGGRRRIDDLAAMVIDVASELQHPHSNEFLDVLPEEVDFATKPKSLRPTAALIELGPLLESSNLEVWRKNKRGVESEIKPKLLLRVLEGALQLKKNGSEWKLRTEAGSVVGTLKQTSNGYSLGRILDSSVEVRNTDANGEKKRLSAWLNSNECFRVVFSNPDYFYTGGQLYLRKGFESDIVLVRRTILPTPGLDLANSEKGKPAPSSPTETQFPTNSIFRIVEDSLLNNAEFLWCSDLGIEWADYVSLQNNTIVFTHCKHGKKTTLGATGYQEVLGQAIKNLGNVKSTPREFAQKIQAAAATNTWGNTGILRLRTPHKTWTEFANALLANFENVNFRREVHLVITMLSARDFDAEVRKPKRRGSFVQLIWLLSAFINSCRDLGAEAKIICKQ